MSHLPSVYLFFVSFCLVLPVFYFVTHLVVSVLGPSLLALCPSLLCDYLHRPDVFHLPVCFSPSPPPSVPVHLSLSHASVNS